MPTVIGTRVKCPECGATSSAIGDALHCAYCGVISRVQKRTQFGMKLPLPPPIPNAANVPQRIAVQQMNPVAKALAISAGVMGVVVGIGGAWTGIQTSSIEKRYVASVSAPNAPGKPPAYLEWTSRPVLADVDNDGISDAIGYVRDVTADQMFLTAVSGATGKKIWGFYLGNYAMTYRKQIALTASAVLVGDHDQSVTLDAYSIATGTKLFTATFGEVVDATCSTASATIVKVVTKDKVESLLDLSTGKVDAVRAKPSKCAALRSSETGHWTRTDFTMRHSRDPVGMRNSGYAGHEAPWIIIGAKDPGSRVPMLAAFDDKDKTLWTVTVPGTNPMAVAFEDPAATDVEGDLVATVYLPTDNRPPMLTTFDRATGARRFEVPITTKPATFATSIGDLAVGKKVIFVMGGGVLRAFDRETGKPLWTIGETR